MTHACCTQPGHNRLATPVWVRCCDCGITKGLGKHSVSPEMAHHFKHDYQAESVACPTFVLSCVLQAAGGHHGLSGNCGMMTTLYIQLVLGHMSIQ